MALPRHLGFARAPLQIAVGTLLLGLFGDLTGTWRGRADDVGMVKVTYYWK